MAEPPADDDAPPTPHDAIFKVVFGEPAHAAVVMRAAFPAPLAAALDWDRLEAGPTVIVGADGRQGARDLRFRTWLRSGSSEIEARVDLLFEHASGPGVGSACASTATCSAGGRRRSGDRDPWPHCR